MEIEPVTEAIAHLLLWFEVSLSLVGERVPGKNIKYELCSTDICAGKKMIFSESLSDLLEFK